MVTKDAIDYVKNQTALGRSRQELEQELKTKGGWSDSDISEVFTASVGPSPTKRGHFWMFIIPVVILALIAVYFYYRNISQSSSSVAVSDNLTPTSEKMETASLYKNKEVYIFVDDTTYKSLSSKLERLSEDIRSDLGVEVNLLHGVYSSASQVRNILKDSYSQGKLLGSIMIGYIPTFSRKDGLYTDWYYGALNDACPIDDSGVFKDNIGCNDLNSFSKRDVFTGRITPPVAGAAGIALVEKYLDKDHAFRRGEITFPRKLLVYPSVDTLAYIGGKSVNHNSLEDNLSIAITSQNRYYMQDVDPIWDRDYLKQKESYLAKLKNNRYEAAVINVHGSPDGEFPSQYYDESQIKSDDIATAKPSVMYVALLSCSNGAFKSPNYLAGEFLFSGDTLLVTANTVETAIGGLLVDPPLEPVFFQPLSFFNSDSPFGELTRHDSSLLATQTFGDPTLRMKADPNKVSDLRVYPEKVDFSTEDVDMGKTKSFSIKNTGPTTASVLILPDWGFTIDDKSLSSFATKVGQIQVMSGKNFMGFTSDQTSQGYYKKVSLLSGESLTFLLSFAAAQTSDGKLVSGVYKDSFFLQTSDKDLPFFDIPITAIVK